MDKQEHRLKIHKKPFIDLQSGAKTCEVRDCSDREFRVGDYVVLMLVDETGNPTQYGTRREITHIQTGYGLPDDLCVLSYAPEVAPLLQGVGVLTFMRSTSDDAVRCACCEGAHVFCRYFKGLPNFDDFTENLRHRNDLEGREFRFTVELAAAPAPVRHS